jgi:hypothetical protein
MSAPLRLLLCLTAVVVTARAQAPRPDPAPAAARKRFLEDFRLLPKSFQSDPRINMTVYSERSDYGRTLPDATPENPVYYQAQSQGFKSMGSEPSGVTPPDQEQIETLVRDVLQKRGFLPASEAHPPTLALFYFWGAHVGLDLKDFDPEEVLERPDLVAQRDRDIFERARLVGGRAYAEKLVHRMTFGSTAAADITTRDDHLRYQIQHSIYYVVISAYDFAGLTRKERRLAWRTTMTVNDQGVSIKETLPAVISSAQNYVGRDTSESVVLERRITRGSVTLGPLTIIGEVPAPASPSPANPPAATPK